MWILESSCFISFVITTSHRPSSLCKVNQIRIGVKQIYHGLGTTSILSVIEIRNSPIWYRAAFGKGDLKIS